MVFRSIIIGFLSFGLCLNIIAQSGFPCYTVYESVNEDADLSVGSLIWMVENEVLSDQLSGIWIDSMRQAGNFDGFAQFEDKLIMRAYFNCSYEFDRYSDTGFFIAIMIHMANGQTNYLVSKTGSEYFYLLYEGQEYVLLSCEDQANCQNYFYQQTKLDTSEITINLRPDSVVVELEPAIFETVTEQMLLKDATTEVMITPATFETQEIGYYAGDELVCPNEGSAWIYVQDSVLIHEAYSILSVEPSIFETVTEQVLVKEVHTVLDSIMVETFDTTITEILLPEHTRFYWPDSLEVCQSLDPFDCIKMDSLRIDSMIVTLDIETTASCPDNYFSCGQYCFRYTSVPSTYEVFTREKLVEPSQVVTEVIPAVYHHFERKKLSTSGPDSCVVAIIDTISQVVIKEPAIVTTTESPAIYTTRTFERLDQDVILTKYSSSFDTTFTKVVAIEQHDQGDGSVVCDDILIAPYQALIVNKLFELAYLEDQSEPFGSSVFWDALFRFQEAHELRIGGVDRETLKALDLE